MRVLSCSGGGYLDPDNKNLPVHGLFRFSPGVGIERLVDSTTTFPGKSEPFEDITEFSANDANVVFGGARYWETYFEGVYSLMNGALQVVADSTMLLPGISSPGSIFYHPLIEGDRIAFITGQEIFQSQNGVLEPLVLIRELIPGRPDSFQGFGNITFDNGFLSFLGLGPSLGTGNWYDRYEGIFSKTSSDLSAVADVFTPIPEGTGSFVTFGPMYRCGGTTFMFSLCSSSPVSQNGQVAFGGWDSTGVNHGLYVSLQGTLIKVADYLSILCQGTLGMGRFSIRWRLTQGPWPSPRITFLHIGKGSICGMGRSFIKFMKCL